VTPEERLTLAEAAMALREEAALLRAGHTLAPNYTWPYDESVAKSEHDKLIALAEKLRAIAKRAA
jgi:hypothetical protein